MPITKEQAIDILDKFDFFQGQRAGRELWNEKPKEVQDEDIATFSKNVALLKEYIADVVPRSECEQCKEVSFNALKDLQETFAKGIQDVAREIFEEIKKSIMSPDQSQNYKEWYFAELKKKYIGEER